MSRKTSEKKGGHSLKDRLGNFRKKRQFTDLFFEVNGTEFDLHSLVLSTRMEDYIISRRTTGRKMRGSGTETSERIKLVDFPGGQACFEDIVQYCYEESSFRITLENATNLYYASKYLLMLEENNLFQSVKQFIDEEIFYEAAEIKNVMRFYKTSLCVENQHNIPHDLSTQTLTHLILKGRTKDPEELMESFVREFNESLATAFVSMEKEQNSTVAKKQVSDFFLDMIVSLQESCETPAKLRKTSARSDTKKQKLAETREGIKILMQSINPASEKILDILQLDEELFSLVENGRAGILSRSLNLQTAKTLKRMSPCSLGQLLEHCTSLLSNKFDEKGLSSKAKSRKRNSLSLTEPDASLLTSLFCKILPALNLKMGNMDADLHQWEKFRKKISNFPSYIHNWSTAQILRMMPDK